MYWLGIDTETTGLTDDPNARVIEVGAVLWDCTTKQPVELFSKLISCDDPLDEFIVGLTGITDDLLQKRGKPFKAVFPELQELAMEAQYIVAHNAPFDKEMLERMCKIDDLCPLAQPWIDSKADVPWNSKTRKLVYLAAEHGFVNPWAHRAVFDVLTMLTIMSEYDFQKVVDRSHEPNITVRAVVEFEERHLAKEKGFHWRPDIKKWLLIIKEGDMAQLQNECQFKVRRYDG